MIEPDRRAYTCCAFVSKLPENHLDTHLKVELMFKEPSHCFLFAFFVSISVKLPAFIGHFLSVRLSACPFIHLSACCQSVTKDARVCTA